MEHMWDSAVCKFVAIFSFKHCSSRPRIYKKKSPMRLSLTREFPSTKTWHTVYEWICWFWNTWETIWIYMNLIHSETFTFCPSARPFVRNPQKLCALSTLFSLLKTTFGADRASSFGKIGKYSSCLGGNGFEKWWKEKQITSSKSPKFGGPSVWAKSPNLFSNPNLWVFGACETRRKHLPKKSKKLDETWDENRHPLFKNPKTQMISSASLLLMEQILHQLIGSLFHYLQGFIHPRWLAGFLPLTVPSERCSTIRTQPSASDCLFNGIVQSWSIDDSTSWKIGMVVFIYDI